MLRLEVGEIDGATGVPLYSVASRGPPIIARSRLGLVFGDDPGSGAGLPAETYRAGLRLVASRTGDHDATWEPVTGERSRVRDH